MNFLKRDSDDGEKASHEVIAAKLIGILWRGQNREMPTDRIISLMARECDLELPPALGRQLNIIATIIEPIDKALGSDEDTLQARAFFLGELIGLVLSQKAFPKLSSAEVCKDENLFGAQTVFDSSSTHDTYEARYLAASNILDAASAGQQSVPNDYDHVLELIGDEISVDPKISQHFRQGVGLIYGSAARLDLEQMRRELNDGGQLNWDQLLSDE